MRHLWGLAGWHAKEAERRTEILRGLRWNDLPKFPVERLGIVVRAVLACELSETLVLRRIVSFSLPDLRGGGLPWCFWLGLVWHPPNTAMWAMTKILYRPRPLSSRLECLETSLGWLEKSWRVRVARALRGLADAFDRPCRSRLELVEVPTNHHRYAQIPPYLDLQRR